MITKEYIEGLSQDETFMEQLEQAASNEEVCELFKSKGLEVTVEDVEEAKNAKELDESDLDNVSGGFLIKGPIYWAGYLLGRLVARHACK